MKKKISIIFCILVFITAFTIIGQANELDINISIEAGFDGKCKAGGINPIKIELSSNDSDFEGDLKLNIDDKVFIYPVSLYRNTKKEFLFSIPILKGNEIIEVSLQKNEKVIKSIEESLEVLPKGSIFIGILSDTPQNYYGISKIDNNLFKDYDIEVVNMDYELKYNLLELKNFNFLLIDNFNVENLSNESQQNLKKWTANGNIVLVGANKYSYKTLTGIFKDLKDIKKIGNGFSIPIKENMEGNTEVIQNTIQKYITSFGVNKIITKNNLEKKVQNINNLYGAVDEILKPNANTVYLLLSCLTVYLILLGIFIHFDRKTWAFSITIISFSIILYGLSVCGGIQKCSTISTSMKIHNNGVNSYSLINIYPNKRDDIYLKFPENSLMDAINTQNYTIDPIEKKVNFIKKHDLEEDTSEDEIYALYKEEHEPYEKEDIKITIEKENIINGEIFNPLPDKMYDCFLMIGDTVISVGDLDGKERRDISYNIDNNLINLGDYNYLQTIYDKTELKDYQKDMFEYYFYNLDDFSYGPRLIGFSRGKEKISINNTDRNIKNVVCNVFDVKIDYTDKQIFMPCGIIKPIIEYGENEEVQERKEYILEDKELKIYYVMPKDIKVESISLYTKVDDGEISLEVFNQKENKWNILNYETFTKDDIPKYISKGFLEIRVQGNGRIIIPQISVKGLKKAGDHND